MAGLAGCLEGVQEHFGLQGVVPLEIHSEADNAYNLQLQARETGTGRESYDESYAVTPEETVMAPNLERTDQNLQVVKYDRDTEDSVARAVSITEDTQLVMVYIRDDDLVVEIHGDDDADDDEIDVIDENSSDDDLEGADGEQMADEELD
nr:hypothetical protein [Natronolimnobius sp. AArcel1]